jgi:hypothetical protein
VELLDKPEAVALEAQAAGGRASDPDSDTGSCFGAPGDPIDIDSTFCDASPEQDYWAQCDECDKWSMLSDGTPPPIGSADPFSCEACTGKVTARAGNKEAMLTSFACGELEVMAKDGAVQHSKADLKDRTSQAWEHAGHTGSMKDRAWSNVWRALTTAGAVRPTTKSRRCQTFSIGDATCFAAAVLEWREMHKKKRESLGDFTCPKCGKELSQLVAMQYHGRHNVCGKFAAGEFEQTAKEKAEVKEKEKEKKEKEKKEKKEKEAKKQHRCDMLPLRPVHSATSDATTVVFTLDASMPAGIDKHELYTQQQSSGKKVAVDERLFAGHESARNSVLAIEPSELIDWLFERIEAGDFLPTNTREVCRSVLSATANGGSQFGTLIDRGVINESIVDEQTYPTLFEFCKLMCTLFTNPDVKCMNLIEHAACMTVLRDGSACCGSSANAAAHAHHFDAAATPDLSRLIMGRRIVLPSARAHQMMAALEMLVPTGGTGAASGIISNPDSVALQQERTKALLARHETELLGLVQVGDAVGTVAAQRGKKLGRLSTILLRRAKEGIDEICGAESEVWPEIRLLQGVLSVANVCTKMLADDIHHDGFRSVALLAVLKDTVLCPSGTPMRDTPYPLASTTLLLPIDRGAFAYSMSSAARGAVSGDLSALSVNFHLQTGLAFDVMHGVGMAVETAVKQA